MKRIVACVTLATALTLSGVAAAGFQQDYFGLVEGDPNTGIGFDVDKVNGVRKVRHAQFYVPIACYNGGVGRQEGFVKGGLRVHDQRFAGTRRWEFVNLDFTDEGDVTIRGRLLGDGLARGTIRVDKDQGEAPPPPCYSGKLRWEAERG